MLLWQEAMTWLPVNIRDSNVLQVGRVITDP